ncbi:MAG: hypothetical protein OEZ36_01675 [Spirochaetota bacterium]|nr:hypothetical protein [Spirochaetota bacterium]
MVLVNIHDYTGSANPHIPPSESLSHKDYYQQISDIARLENSERLIGFYGQPDQRTIDIFSKSGYSFIDLDIDFKSPNQKIVPQAYCHIIRDIINNAIHFKDRLELIICTTGRDKCDQGRNVRDILSQTGFRCIDASNINQRVLRPPLISESRGNLKDKVIRIMQLVYKPLTVEEESYYASMRCEPSFNYHGVPPQDIGLLDLFPDDCHIHGWTRLVEMGIPARDDLEWTVTNNRPTVYFSQSFCNKQIMAENLARERSGLYIDGHGMVTDSLRAKLEAFLSLRARQNGSASRQSRQTAAFGVQS